MENVSLITAKKLKKIASVVKTGSPPDMPVSSLQIRLQPHLVSTFKIVRSNTFTRYRAKESTISKVLIVLTGSALSHQWYIASFLDDSEEGQIALISGSRKSWLAALIFFMRFKLARSLSLPDLYKAETKAVDEREKVMSAKLDQRFLRNLEQFKWMGE